MATTNYNLPTISGASPVAIVDDYNALANATDAALAGAISGEKTRAMAAETELANGVSNALTTASSANVSASDAKSAADKASTAASAEATRATAAENALSADLATVKAMFPVDSSNLADGAVTAPKLADTALNAIWQGLEIKHFNNTDSSADNEGMSVASSVAHLEGFYIPALTLLVITRYQKNATSSADTAACTLPSYVPVPVVTSGQIVSLGNANVFSSSNNFVDFTGVGFRSGGTLQLNTAQTNSTVLYAPLLTYMSPYIDATAATNAAAYTEANGLIDNA